MANALRDQNYIPAKLAVLNTDGTTLVPLKINQSNGGIKVNAADTVSFTMTPIDKRDQNSVPVMMFEGTDGLTYPAVANASGELLIKPF